MKFHECLKAVTSSVMPTALPEGIITLSHWIFHQNAGAILPWALPSRHPQTARLWTRERLHDPQPRRLVHMVFGSSWEDHVSSGLWLILRPNGMHCSLNWGRPCPSLGGGALLMFGNL